MFWTTLAASFLAILGATGTVAYFNSRFIKKERWHATADAICVNLENMIIAYFSATAGEREQKTMKTKYHYYLDSLSTFALGSNILARGARMSFNRRCDVLRDLDNLKNEADGMRRALESMADIKLLIAR